MKDEITGLKETIAKQQEELDIYRKMFDHSSDPMMILEPGSSKILAVNNKAEEVYGFEKEEFIGMSIDQLSNNPENEKNKINEFTEKNFIDYKFEITHFKKDRTEVILSVVLVPYKYKGNNAVLFISRDITSRKKDEAEARKNLEELKKINENKDKFFGMISHDLRSPFNSLLLFSEYLLQNLDNLSKSELKEIIGDLHIASQNLFNLVESLLNWSRIQMGRYEFKPMKLNLLEVSAFVIELLKGQAKEKNILLNDYIDINSFVFADRTMLTSILQNLIANAIKFTPRDGLVEIYSQENNGTAEISVSDTGTGISEANINKLFKVETSFSTFGTNMEGGTGLGLILCKEFINRHGGDIKVSSKIGTGSIFTFTLPGA